MRVKSTVDLNMPRIRQLTQAAVTALELTAEALHTEVIQAQVFRLIREISRMRAHLWITASPRRER